MLYEELDQICVTIVCGKHELTLRFSSNFTICLLYDKRLTSVSPFSFVRFGGIPSRTAFSNTVLFPSRAALYICAASLMASSDGEKAVAEVSCELDMLMGTDEPAPFFKVDVLWIISNVIEFGGSCRN